MRIYVFAIGGTGIRVMNSLVMLLSAGVKAPKNTEIVPILIDPHQAGNDELTKCNRLLEAYTNLYTKYKDTGFFNTKLSTLATLRNTEEQVSRTDSGAAFNFDFSQTGGQKFGEFVDYGSLIPEDKSFFDMFFSHANKASTLNLGFRGNPNMGTVVLNKMMESKEFELFKTFFTPQDRIFLIGSIFGGTGAAGFPLLLTNFLENSREFIKNAVKGALIVTPYFNLSSPQESDSLIDSNSFITKTKAALAYYESNIKGLDNVYYLGDEAKCMHDNDETKQENDSHLIEMMGATSILHFIKNTDSSNNKESSKQRASKYFELAVKKGEADLVSLNDLPDNIREQIEASLIQLFMLYYIKQTSEAETHQPWFRESIEEGSKKVRFSDDLDHIMKTYISWLRDLASKERKFKPIDLEQVKAGAHIMHLWFTGKRIPKGNMMKKGLNVDTINRYLNKVAQNGFKQFPQGEEKLLAVVHEAIGKVHEEFIEQA